MYALDIYFVFRLFAFFIYPLFVCIFYLFVNTGFTRFHNIPENLPNNGNLGGFVATLQVVYDTRSSVLGYGGFQVDGKSAPPLVRFNK